MWQRYLIDNRVSGNIFRLSILSVPVLLIALSSIFFPKSKIPTRDLIAPPKQLIHLSFGYREVFADTLWVRAIQDFDYCEKRIAENVCSNNSWLYQVLDLITDLSPSFRIPYAAGSLALSVIISDIGGATLLFDKGVKAFPRDWPILYRAAYHYLYELNDKKKAAEFLIQAGQNGAPPWVFTLAGRLYTDTGHTSLAETLLQEMIDSKQDPEMIKRLRDKINSYKSAASL